MREKIMVQRSSTTFSNLSTHICLPNTFFSLMGDFYKYTFCKLIIDCKMGSYPALYILYIVQWKVKSFEINCRGWLYHYLLVLLQHHLWVTLWATVATFPVAHWLQALQVTIFPENVGFGNMRIITLISIVSWLPMSSWSSPFTYKAVEVIFGSIYFYFHLQTTPNLQDCPHSYNLPTFP